MKIIEERYNIDGLYIVVSDITEECGKDAKPLVMFYPSKEVYQEIQSYFKEYDNEFDNALWYGNYK